MNEIRESTNPKRVELSEHEAAVNLQRRRLLRWSMLSAGSMNLLGACAHTEDDAQLIENVPPVSEGGGTSARPPIAAPTPGATPAPTPAPEAPPSEPIPETPPPTTTAAPGTLPSWVPPPGEVAVLTQSNGFLANRFRDIVAPYQEPFYSVKIVNDYSTAYKNPYWGAYGCTVFFGGGHAGTNDNMVAVAEYGPTAITFKRVCDPTPWFGTGTDATTRSSNSIGNVSTLLNTTYMEALSDGKPGAPHSYGSGDIIGPEHGGAANGTFARVITAAVGSIGLEGALASHELRFASPLTPSSQLNWVRMTNEARPTTVAWTTPHLTAFVGSQQRIYIQTNDSFPYVRWYDRTLKTWVTGTGKRFDFDASYGGGANGDSFDSGIMFHVPARGLLICMYPVNDNLIVQWIDVTVAQPTLGGTAKLSRALTLTWPWSAACWCPHNNRIIVAGVAGDNTAAYEVEIPANAADTWTVVRAPFGAGQTFVPGDPAAGIGVTYKKWHYDEKVRAIVYMPFAAHTGDDKVWVYRPRST